MRAPEVQASYFRVADLPIGGQRQLDPGVSLDITQDGRLVGVEIIGPRTLAEVLELVLQAGRF
jgi:uncharacterized protein YuzE